MHRKCCLGTIRQPGMIAEAGQLPSIDPLVPDVSNAANAYEKPCPDRIALPTTDFPGQRSRDSLLHPGVETEHTASFALGVVHRSIRVMQQLLRRISVFRKNADTDAGADI